MKQPSFASEAELGPPVLAWFAERGYDLYQEVVVESWSADVVGVLGPLVAVAELKRSFTFDVIAQAKRRTMYAHHTYVAVPWAKDSDGRRLALRVCEQHGIGVLFVAKNRYGGGVLAELEVAPRLDRRALSGYITSALHERQKTFAPAGTDGQRWTGFKATAEEVIRLVTKSPGISMKDLVGSFKHHYANDKSARAHLAHWIDKGVIGGVRIEREGRALKLYPAEVTP